MFLSGYYSLSIYNTNILDFLIIPYFKCFPSTLKVNLTFQVEISIKVICFIGKLQLTVDPGSISLQNQTITTVSLGNYFNVGLDFQFQIS